MATRTYLVMICSLMYLTAEFALTFKESVTPTSAVVVTPVKYRSLPVLRVYHPQIKMDVDTIVRDART